jgi:hypothetical protein
MNEGQATDLASGSFFKEDVLHGVPQPCCLMKLMKRMSGHEFNYFVVFVVDSSSAHVVFKFRVFTTE